MPETAGGYEGESFPPFGKALELAKCLYVLFGYLFLSEPPDEKPPIPDLRTVDPNSAEKVEEGDSVKLGCE